jgi:hypothetical protein
MLFLAQNAEGQQNNALMHCLLPGRLQVPATPPPPQQAEERIPTGYDKVQQIVYLNTWRTPIPQLQAGSMAEYIYEDRTTETHTPPSTQHCRDR